VPFFFSSRRRHTRSYGDWSSDVCSSDLVSNRKLPVFVSDPRATVIPGAETGLPPAAGATGLVPMNGLSASVGLGAPAGVTVVNRSEERRVGGEGGWGVVG